MIATTVGIALRDLNRGACIGETMLRLASSTAPRPKASRTGGSTRARVVRALLTVMFFNQPKVVMPPLQRSKPGAIGEPRTARPRKRR